MATENIEGTATDPDGNPLEDATIYVFVEQNTEPDGTQFTGVKTSTDSNGDFVLKDHPAADGSSQEWHVAGFYQDGTGEFNALSKPSVKASVGPAIPDSEDLYARYDATELSATDGDDITLWPDKTGQGRDLDNGTAPSYVASGINGNPVVRFDDTNNERLYTDGLADQPQPNQIFVVAKLRTVSAGYAVVYGSESTSNGFTQDLIWDFNSADNVEMFAGSSVIGNAADTNPHIFNALYNSSNDTSNSILRRDGTQTKKGDAGNRDLGDFYVGGSYGNFGPVDVGEILIYPQDKTAIQSDVESYLSDKWGITI